MYETIGYAVDDPVATITLNRPAWLNAITGQMIADLQDAFGRTETDERVVGIVRTSAGRGFCAGADIERRQGAVESGSAAVWDLGDGKPWAIEEMAPAFSSAYSTAWPCASRSSRPSMAHARDWGS